MLFTARANPSYRRFAFREPGARASNCAETALPSVGERSWARGPRTVRSGGQPVRAGPAGQAPMHCCKMNSRVSVLAGRMVAGPIQKTLADGEMEGYTRPDLAGPNLWREVWGCGR